MTDPKDCRALQEILDKFDPKLTQRVEARQIKVAIAALVFVIHFCVLLCLRPHVRAYRKPRTALSVLLFAIVGALGTWYIVLVGRREDLKPSLTHEAVQELDANCEYPPALIPYHRRGPYRGDIIAAVTGVFLALAPLFFMCSWFFSSSRSLGRDPPVDEDDMILLALERPPDSFDVRGLLQRFRMPPDCDLGALSDNLCAICIEEMTANTISILDCKHCYHEKCLRKWLRTGRQNASCPLCKSDIVNQQV